jgi:hypothetical protein
VKSRGFTFTELLAILAICATIAVVLTPILARAQGTTARPDCQQHMSQCMKGLLLYCAANDDSLPPVDQYGFTPAWGNPTGSAGPDLPWPYLLQPYVGSYDVLICPNDPVRNHSLDPRSDGAPSATWRAVGLSRVPEAFHTNLGFNYQWLSNASGSDPNALAWHIVRLSQVGSRANTIAFVDTAFGRNAAGGPVGGGSFYIDAPLNPPNFVGNKPGLGENGWVCYTFGHGVMTSPYCQTHVSAFGKGHAWHPAGQAFMAAFLDMHVRAMTAAQLVHGWDINGNVNYNTFLWDTYQ